MHQMVRQRAEANLLKAPVCQHRVRQAAHGNSWPRVGRVHPQSMVLHCPHALQGGAMGPPLLKQGTPQNISNFGKHLARKFPNAAYILGLVNTPVAPFSTNRTHQDPPSPRESSPWSYRARRRGPGITFRLLNSNTGWSLLCLFHWHGWQSRPSGFHRRESRP